MRYLILILGALLGCVGGANEEKGEHPRWLQVCTSPKGADAILNQSVIINIWAPVKDSRGVLLYTNHENNIRFKCEISEEQFQEIWKKVRQFTVAAPASAPFDTSVHVKLVKGEGDNASVVKAVEFFSFKFGIPGHPNPIIKAIQDLCFTSEKLKELESEELK